jgi:hypothetical protein
MSGSMIPQEPVGGAAVIDNRFGGFPVHDFVTEMRRGAS